MGWLIPIGAGVLTYAVSKKFLDALTIAKSLDYSVQVKTFQLTWTSLKIVLDIIVKNPTQFTISFTQPLVSLYFVNSQGQKEFIAQNSITNNQHYFLPAFGQTVVQNIGFDIPFWTLLKLFDKVYHQRPTSLDDAERKIRASLSYQVHTKVNGIDFSYSGTLEGLGYSPISAIDRPIVDCSVFDVYFKKPEYKKKKISPIIEAENTVTLMKRIIKQDAPKIKKFSQLFKAQTIEDTAQKIYDWTTRCLKYNLERGEQLKNPIIAYDLAQRKARQFHRQNGYYKPEYSVDCDDLAIFVGSILYNLGIPFSIRLASYNSDGRFQHVYIVAKDSNGKELIIDPVYWQFNSEKKPTRKKDYAFAGLDDVLNIDPDQGVFYLYGIPDQLGDISLLDVAGGVIFPPYAVYKLIKERRAQETKNQKQNLSTAKQLHRQLTQPKDNAQNLQNQLDQMKRKHRNNALLIGGLIGIPVLGGALYLFENSKSKKNE